MDKLTKTDAELLQAYKDTGLEPEEVKSLKETWDLFGGAEGVQRVYVERDEYKQAESEGRLIVLPCKMGDTVWRIYSDSDIVESRISMLQQKADRTWKVRLSDYWGVHDVNINEIGKTIFPTREAAETALRSDGDG